MADFILLETSSDRILLETGDRILLESQVFMLDAQPGLIAITGFLAELDIAGSFNPGSIVITGFDAGLFVGPLVVTCCTGIAPIGVPYSSSFTVTGGRSPYTWSIISGSLPTGLSLNASTGAVTGTPTVSGGFPFTVRVVSGDGNTEDTDCGITVTSAPVIGSGLYKLIPNQRHDVLYTIAPTTTNVIISWFIQTYLAGDE